MVTQEELKNIISQKGFPNFRAKQIIQAIFNENKDKFEDIQVLPKDLRAFLAEQITVFSITPETILQSKDKKTTKVLFKTKDEKELETVLMRYDDGRATVCVSSQIGCQMGCSFCATGKMGFTRNLTAEEITDQVLYFVHLLGREGKRVTNIVFMGMGEPFMNYKNLLEAIRDLNNADTFNIGARSMTVSTSGLVEGIEQFADEQIQVNLAISLHAPTQELRAKIMPVARKYPLDQLMEAARHYIQKTNRRITYEYIMIKGVNDSLKDASELASLVKDQLCHINLIPYNAAGTKDFRKSDLKTIEEFKEILEKRGVIVTIRHSSGGDIAAACGQLANKKNN